METRFNPMRITGAAAFGDVRGRTAAGVRSVYFVMCVGYYSGFADEIKALDKRMSEDTRCIYRRITEFPVPDVKEAEEYGEKWEKLSRGENILSEERKAALKEVCDLYKAARGNISPSIEKNLAVTLIKSADESFETHKYLSELRGSMNRQYSNDFDEFCKKYSI